MMTGIQAEGAAPIANAVRKGKSSIEPVINPETVATAIRIGAPVSAQKHSGPYMILMEWQKP